MIAVLLTIIFLVAFLLGRWSGGAKRITVTDTFNRPVTKMTEHGLRCRMAAKLANEIAPHIKYIKVSGDTYNIALDIYQDATNINANSKSANANPKSK